MGVVSLGLQWNNGGGAMLSFVAIYPQVLFTFDTKCIMWNDFHLEIPDVYDYRGGIQKGSGRQKHDEKK